MRIGAAQGEVHARFNVPGRPVCLPVGPDGGKRTVEIAGRVGLPVPDMTLVDVGVHVGKAGPDHASLQINAFDVRWGCPSR